jgi:hypothetical protein
MMSPPRTCGSTAAPRIGSTRRAALQACLGAAALAVTVLPAAAQVQVPVMAGPTASSSYATFDNQAGFRTGASVYDFGRAVTWPPSPTKPNVYMDAPTLMGTGVPSSNFSVVLTQDNPANTNAAIASTATIPAMGTTPTSFINPVVPAGTASPYPNLGGLIYSFGWTEADIVMQQCFGGDFAFNLQGSLQGALTVATPGNPSVFVPPVRGGTAAVPMPYTFTSAANYNELSAGFPGSLNNMGVLVKNPAAGITTLNALSDFTQGQAFGSTNTAPAGTASNAFGLYASYRNGRVTDPFTVGSTPYGNIAIQIPGYPGSITSAGFESPVYASSAAPAASNVPANRTVIASNPPNSVTYATNAANRFAVLVAFTPGDTVDFQLQIEREYAALISNGVPQNHIAVLYGNGTMSALPQFPNITAGNVPNVNSILNTIARGFTVPVNGAASQANIEGLLSPTINYPGTNMSYWQHFYPALNVRPGQGTSSLLFYSTGHGSAFDQLGNAFTGVNKAIGAGFSGSTLMLAGPANVPIVSGENFTVQIATQGALVDPGSDLFSVDGISVGGDTVASVAGGTAFDLTDLVEENGLNYYDVTMPTTDLSSTGSEGFSFSISSTDDLAITSFDQDIVAITLMDDVPTVCATGACDMWTDLVAPVPEPSSLLELSSLLALGGLCALRRRQAFRSFG